MSKKFGIRFKLAGGMLFFGLLAACAEQKIAAQAPQLFEGGERIAARSESYTPLSSLPVRTEKINIAVYDFPDLTGANASNDDFADFSKAVTQGADALVVEALTDVGRGTWFRVLERRFNDAVLNERRIVQTQALDDKQRKHVAQENTRVTQAEDAVEADYMRNRAVLERDYQRFAAERKLPNGYPTKEQALSNLANFRADQLRNIKPPQAFSAAVGKKTIPTLSTADYLVTGSIVAYDTNTETGGTGFRIANIGVRQERRKDIITINLRIVRVSTGEILANKTVTQSVLSIRKQGDTLNYVTVNTILEFESGLVTNEPATLALDAAIRVALSGALMDLQAIRGI